MMLTINVILVLSDFFFFYIKFKLKKKKVKVPNNVIVGTIICEVGNIMCDIGTINMRFYLLKVPYLHGYCRIT
jgi:hypothetical protein